ncbi:MAG: hypothetical protein E7613_08385 [Ruminococcaceae bacterium]|nr:hypothetical protein [Oscillospiraceae bacterium]
MPNEIYFRTSFSGYNKSDVISFIEKLNREQVERVNSLNDTIRKSQEETKHLSDELENAQKRCAQLEEEVKQLIADRSANEEKAQKYETMQGTYADIMLEAEYTSKEKVRIAEEKADRMIKEAEETRRMAAAENKRIIETTKVEFMTLIEKLTSSLDETIAKIGVKDNE